MLTNNKQKLIISLQQKKFREEHALFAIEGIKIISEFICNTNLVEEVFIAESIVFSDVVMKNITLKNIELSVVDEKSLKKISNVTSPQNCIALVKMPIHNASDLQMINERVIALDEIQDPGNLGTIIRTADWFGIRTIVCSSNSVDCYNPKVVQATMGSICSTKVYYTNLSLFLEQAKNNGTEIYGTLLEGEDINTVQISPKGILLLGNESNGISAINKSFITKAITIKKSATAFAESLNIAVAASICCSRW